MRKYIREYFVNLKTVFSAVAAFGIDGCNYDFDEIVIALIRDR